MTNGGAPVGGSPYTAIQVPQVTFGGTCGVELASGVNELVVSTIDQAGNPALPVVMNVTYVP